MYSFQEYENSDDEFEMRETRRNSNQSLRQTNSDKSVYSTEEYGQPTHETLINFHFYHCFYQDASIVTTTVKKEFKLFQKILLESFNGVDKEGSNMTQLTFEQFVEKYDLEDYDIYLYTEWIYKNVYVENDQEESDYDIVSILSDTQSTIPPNDEGDGHDILSITSDSDLSD